MKRSEDVRHVGTLQACVREDAQVGWYLGKLRTGGAVGPPQKQAWEKSLRGRSSVRSKR